MARLTRKEKQAHTRQCLMKSAARVFARRGLQQASIDEVAEDAGFTKGAFYANFKSKEELFLAMLDERFTQRIEDIERVIADEGSGPEKARRAGRALRHHAHGLLRRARGATPEGRPAGGRGCRRRRLRARGRRSAVGARPGGGRRFFASAGGLGRRAGGVSQRAFQEIS